MLGLWRTRVKEGLTAGRARTCGACRDPAHPPGTRLTRRGPGSPAGDPVHPPGTRFTRRDAVPPAGTRFIHLHAVHPDRIRFGCQISLSCRWARLSCQVRPGALGPRAFSIAGSPAGAWYPAARCDRARLERPPSRRRSLGQAGRRSSVCTPRCMLSRGAGPPSPESGTPPARSASVFGGAKAWRTPPGWLPGTQPSRPARRPRRSRSSSCARRR